MRIQIITDQSDAQGIRIIDIQQFLDLLGPIPTSSMGPDIDFPPTPQWLCQQKIDRGSCPFIFIIISFRLAGLSWQRGSRFSNQLRGLFVHTNHGHPRIIGQTRHVPTILQVSDKCRIMLRRNAPTFPQMGVQLRFFKTCRTVSWESVSSTPVSINRSARKRHDHRVLPVGGIPHRRAMMRASWAPSIKRFREGYAWCCRSNAASKPSSTNRWRIWRTVWLWQFKTEAIISSGRFGPSTSTFNKIWACLIL
jgi:hypothetical protein